MRNLFAPGAAYFLVYLTPEAVIDLTTDFTVAALPKSPTFILKFFIFLFLRASYCNEIIHDEYISRFDILMDDRRLLVVTETEGGH